MFRLLSLLLAACSLLLPALDAVAQPVTRVYRADSRSPEEVFAHGFTGRGGNLDVLAHARGDSCTEDDPRAASAFVGMSADEAEATLFASEQLEDRPGRGPETGLWIYTIRADATFFSVPRLLERVVDAGYTQRQGYTPDHARIALQLLQTTGIVDEAEVLSSSVPPTLVIEAYRVWLDHDDELDDGPVHRNPSYIDANTQAESEGVPLDVYVSAASLANHDPLPTPVRTCAMSCDGAHSAWQRATRSYPTLQCKATPGLTPLLLDIIID